MTLALLTKSTRGSEAANPAKSSAPPITLRTSPGEHGRSFSELTRNSSWESNPFVGLTRFSNTSSIQEATREEAYALSDAIKSYGHPHLAIVPLVCFEWYQRPENILAGYLRWSDYRPSERPNHVRIVHHKTDEVVWHPLDENGQRFYPELEARLAELYRMAIPIVVTPGKRGTAHPYSFSYANRIVRKAARAAGIT